jgi:acetyl-CoA C-acetyltransferase
VTSIDPRTPVLVGVGAVLQREEDPSQASEPYEMMVQALKLAADDAGNRELLARADSVRAPRGFWDYRDPCRLVADALGAFDARTEVAQIGVLQTTLLGRAAADIASGAADIVLVTGAEAKYRALRAQIAGSEASMTEQPEGVYPDSVLEPAEEIYHPLEVDCGLLMPVNSYSMIENALRGVEGISIEEHRREVAELWAGFGSVAVYNPHAWNRDAIDAAVIAEGGNRNRMLAFPYTKLHTSQWNVDQAAGLILCSVEAARRAGVAEDLWVFPHCVVDSNHMVPLIERADLHRSHGFELAGRRAGELCGGAVSGADHVELYSCFPSAVRIQMREMNIARDRPVTVTGGMTFAGGPLNNFVLQAMVRMAEVLRAEPGSAGLVTAVSGIVTKQGVSVWSTQRPARAFAFEDVTEQAAAALRRVEIVEPPAGADATVASYTVLYEDGAPVSLVLLCDLAGGRRTLVAVQDAALAAAAVESDPLGRDVRIEGAGRASLP